MPGVRWAYGTPPQLHLPAVPGSQDLEQHRRDRGWVDGSPGVYDRPLPTARKWNVIDRLRQQIQQRLDQLTHEADRLRKALAALDRRAPSDPARNSPARKTGAAPKPKTPATNSTSGRRTSQPAARSPRRTAPGATKASVLAALAGGEAMTAGQVAGKTGLARPTVSTTLSKLSKTGEVQKAERGYRIASAAGE